MAEEHNSEGDGHEHGETCNHGHTGEHGIEPQDRFAGKSIPESAFADDDGSPDENLTAMLEAAKAGTADRHVVQAALLSARVFVPVVAILDSEDVTGSGQRVEKDSHMATVSVQRADGAKALLAFSSTDRMAAWNKEARPVATLAPAAAQAAIDVGSVAMIIDYGHDHGFVLDGVGLSKLANQEVWSNPLTDNELMTKLASALAQVGAAEDVTYEALPSGGQEELRIVIKFLPALHGDDSETRRDEIINQVATTLQQDQDLAAGLPGGVALAVQMAG